MIFTEKIHRAIYWFGLTLTACALPVSFYFTSVGLIVLAVNFLCQGQWRGRWERLRTNRSLQLGMLVYAPLVLSFGYSADYATALHRLQLWLPLLLVPLIIGLNDPLNRREMQSLLVLFVLSVLTASIIAACRLPLYYSGAIGSIREVYYYISHIRFALMVVLAIAAMVYMGQQWRKGWQRMLMLLVALWFVVLLLLMRVVTGLFMLFWLLVVLAYFKGRAMDNAQHRRMFCAVCASFVLVMLVGGAMLCRRYYRLEPVDFKSLPEFTANGNPYTHDTLRPFRENGHRTDLLVCESEMRRAWNVRSTFDYDERDNQHQEISSTLRRYLTSLGLPKDSFGVAQLDSLDQVLIETSHPSVLYRNKRNPYLRIYETLYEFQLYMFDGHVEGSTVQRLAYISAAARAFAQKPLFGVGCGDLQPALDVQYEQSTKRLPCEFWQKPHNQYLTVAVCAGLVGLVLFLVGMIVPFVRQRGYAHFMPLFFWGMMFLSMLSDDPLETHTGTTLMALFGALFIYGYNWFASDGGL